MAIASRQIGQSTRSNLLWQISKQLERLICVRAGGCVSTTTTTTTISYYYYSGSNCNSPLFGQVIRNIIPLSIGDVVLATDGNCYIIGGVYVGPDYNVEYVSTETCFVDPCPTTTTTTTIASCVEVSFDATDNCPLKAYAIVEYTDCDGVDQIGNVVAGSGNTLKVCTLVGGITPAFTCGDGEVGYGSSCTSPTTTTTTTKVLINTNYTFVNCPGPCFESECAPLNYFNIWMTQGCINSWPTIGCEVWLDSEGTIPFANGSYNNGEGGCVYIVDGMVSLSPPPPPYRYYNVNEYSCNPCNFVGTFTAFVPYNTPLTIGYFYNNPENRGYSFEIVDELATSGAYDLTAEPGYATCLEACP
jgi:hypothetical protein